MKFDRNNWYCIVNSTIYSTASGTTVPENDPTYIAWKNQGNFPNNYRSFFDLDENLVLLGLPISGLAPITKDQLVEYTNQKQWALAIGGYTAVTEHGPLFLNTDPISYSLITGKATRLLQPGAPLNVDWQINSTTWVEILATDFITASIHVADFMQSTFDAAKIIVEAIIAGTITTKEEVDSATWPVNHG